MLFGIANLGPRAAAGVRVTPHLGELRTVCQRAQAPAVSHRLSDRLYRGPGHGWEVFHGEPITDRGHDPA